MLKRLLVSKYGQDYSLESFDRKLADSQNLTVRQDVKVRHNNLPNVINAADVDESSFHKTAHRKGIDLRKDLTLS